jgi:hypothetical protein
MAAGCASAPKLTSTNPEHRIEASDQAIRNVRSWLAARSLLAQNMSVTGDVTFDQNGESNSASFAMKSKRLDANGDRIDSLSVEVLGPFGIKLARFLASPEQYSFYDLLHGQPVSGPTDAKSLEDLTQLKAVSLETMSDLIYGIAGSDLRPNDSVRFYTSGASHYVMIVQNATITSSLDLEGTLPGDSSMGNLMLVRYRRWSGRIDPTESRVPPDVSVRFSEPVVVNGISIPQHIDAKAGANSLTLTYDHIDVNSRSLTVKIKMPSQ